jgi:PAS domain S-box-containing protein
VTIKSPQLSRLFSLQHGTLEAHLAAIVTSSDDAIISKDLNGIIQSWNRGAQRIFGYTPEEAIGKHISLLAVPDRVEEFGNILERISRGEHIDHFHTKRRAKDGRVLSISLTVSPIRDNSGTIVGASKIARDITDQIRYQQALREANESLRRLNADLEQFTHSASHDLQEPLRMITVYAEMIQRKFGGQLGPNGDQYINYIVSGVARMEHLLSDLRAFTQASLVEKDLAQSVDAGEALAIALANLTTIVQENKASITYGPLPRVHVPRFQMEQLFQNLIGNAIRYRSQKPPEIQVAAELCGAEWRFSVRDNGIGIDPQYKEQIFGIFKRLHSQAEYPGTGMGLAICQRIVERAGGRIWVESEFGRGSTFLFTLPAGRNQGS